MADHLQQARQSVQAVFIEADFSPSVYDGAISSRN